MTEKLRRRTIEWEDTTPALSAAVTMNGLDYLNATFLGDLPGPPIAATLGMHAEKLEEGKVTFGCTPAEYHNNPNGTTHGGLAATLLDSAMACAVHSTLPAGVGYTTLELKVNYVRAITPQTGRIYATGTILHRGRRTATAEGRIVDEQGKLLAHGTTTCLIFEHR